MSFNKPGSIRRALLAQVDRAKFHKAAEPGDQLTIRLAIKQRMEDAARITAQVDAGGEKIARAALTFVMKKLDSEKIHQQRRYFYKIWTKHLENIPEIL